MVVPSKMKTSSYLMLDQVLLVWQMLAPTPMAANFSFALSRFWKAWIPLSSLNHKRLIEETALGRRWLSVTVVSFQCLKP
ncbi:hypothetical protein Golax_017445, partial [Gossypium laxum]|nr:hypothetical protein [Gossypium laxum]